jgi:hypothetical protein
VPAPGFKLIGQANDMSNMDSFAMLLAVTLASLGFAATMLVLYIRRGSRSAAPEALTSLREGVQRLETQLREETARNRQEVTGVVREARAETTQALGQLTESLMTRFAEHGAQQQNGLQGFGELLTGLSKREIDRRSAPSPIMSSTPSTTRDLEPSVR